MTRKKKEKKTSTVEHPLSPECFLRLTYAIPSLPTSNAVVSHADMRCNGPTLVTVSVGLDSSSGEKIENRPVAPRTKSSKRARYQHSGLGAPKTHW